jgi:hypothetical protein
MTAVAATRYDDLLALDETLTETLVEALDEETVKAGRIRTPSRRSKVDPRCCERPPADGRWPARS